MRRQRHGRVGAEHRDRAGEHEARRVAGALRSASSSARVLSMLERRPRSKSSSHSPETAEARWNTPSKRSRARPAHSPSSAPVRASTRASASRSGGGSNWSASTSGRCAAPAERAALQQRAGEPCADEAGGACDQQFHLRGSAVPGVQRRARAACSASLRRSARAAGRLHCAARSSGPSQNSLRSLRSLRSNMLRQVSSRSALARGPEALRCSSPQRRCARRPSASLQAPPVRGREGESQALMPAIRPRAPLRARPGVRRGRRPQRADRRPMKRRSPQSRGGRRGRQRICGDEKRWARGRHAQARFVV